MEFRLVNMKNLTQTIKLVGYTKSDKLRYYNYLEIKKFVKNENRTFLQTLFNTNEYIYTNIIVTNCIISNKRYLLDKDNSINGGNENFEKLNTLQGIRLLSENPQVYAFGKEILEEDSRVGICRFRELYEVPKITITEPNSENDITYCDFESKEGYKLFLEKYIKSNNLEDSLYELVKEKEFSFELLDEIIDEIFTY